jgi:hypothetical protein
VRHLLFQCPVAQDMWCMLGLEEVISEAMTIDREGSAILEHIIITYKVLRQLT